MACASLILLGVFTLFSTTCALPRTPHHRGDQQQPLSRAQQCSGSKFISAQFQSRHVCPAINLYSSDDPSWGPWTYQPYCNRRDYCVFTNSFFRKQHGISIVTTRESLADTPKLLDVLFSIPTPREPDPPPYEILAVPGRGIGVRATRRIRRYEIVMTDAVSVLVDRDIPRRMTHAEGLALLQVAMDQLPEPEKLLGLARSSENLSAPVPDDVMKTNAFDLSFNDVGRMALFPKISRINHECDPNSALRWTDEALECAIVALRDIEPGEEISISYTVYGMTHEARQEALLSRWGFECTCPLCSASPNEVEESDKRRERLKELRDEIRSLIRKQQYKAAIKAQHEVIKVSETERLTSQIDRRNSVKYAKVAYEELKRYREGGSALNDVFKDLEQFLAENK